ncbi:unnamed protein product [Caenorhabditis brenneri]
MKLQFIFPLLFILLAIVGHSDAQDEPNTELGKKLRKQFDENLEIIKDAYEYGKNMREVYLEKQIRQSLKDLLQGVVDKIKERIQKQKDKLDGTVEANP